MRKTEDLDAVGYKIRLFPTKKQEYMLYCKKALAELGSIIPVRTLSEIKWKPFYIDEIFSVESGKRLESYNMESGTRPFIGAIDSGNGITNYV